MTAYVGVSRWNGLDVIGLDGGQAWHHQTTHCRSLLAIVICIIQRRNAHQCEDVPAVFINQYSLDVDNAVLHELTPK